jgi:putative DNA primase/helicase
MSASSGHGQVVPITGATNQGHLEMLAGDQWPNVLVASFMGDPTAPKPGDWQSAPAGTCLHNPNFDLGNTFYCPMLFRPGIWRRQGLEQAVGLIALTFDDVGTGPTAKISEVEITSVLRCGPTYLIETSPGNFQAGWKTTGMTDMAWVKGMLAQLDRALGGKADNLTNPIAWRRLPVGRNMKAALGLGPQGWRVRSRLLRPDRVVDQLDFLDLDGVGTIVPMTTLDRGTGNGQRPDDGLLAADPVYQALNEGGRVIGDKITSDRFWAATIKCPWIAEHGPTRPLSGAEYVPAIGGRDQKGWFHCFHCERRGRNQGAFREQLDVALRDEGQKIVAAFEFDDVDAADPALFAPSPAAVTAAAHRVLAQYEATEDGLALAFAAEHADRLRFDHLRQKWFVWAIPRSIGSLRSPMEPGSYWQQDGTAQAFRWARQLARAFRGMQDAAVKALGKIAVAGAIERAARADGRLAVDGKGWDPDPWLAGAPGCEIDLRTGESLAPDPAHQVTRQLRVAPEDQPTPVWDQFLWDSTAGDLEMILFLQAWFGYCLTGDTSEEKFVFIFGPGGNGKSTFVGVMTEILRDYAVVTPVDTFMQRKHAAHPTEIARLDGARAVIANEIEEGATFNAVRLKELTGGGSVAARFTHQNFFQFVPQFKVTFVGNHQPKIVHVDEAMRRRLILVPFTQIPRHADPTLKERLRQEYPGILAWAIKGENLRRAMGGLANLIPTSVVAATGTYLDDQDTFKAWATERCEFGAGPGFRMPVREGFEDYRTWCWSNGCQPVVAERQFSRKFVEVYTNCRHLKTNQAHLLEGVRFLPQIVG